MLSVILSKKMSGAFLGATSYSQSKTVHSEGSNAPWRPLEDCRSVTRIDECYERSDSPSQMGRRPHLREWGLGLSTLIIK